MGFISKYIILHIFFNELFSYLDLKISEFLKYKSENKIYDQRFE